MVEVREAVEKSSFLQTILAGLGIAGVCAAAWAWWKHSKEKAHPSQAMAGSAGLPAPVGAGATEPQRQPAAGAVVAPSEVVASTTLEQGKAFVADSKHFVTPQGQEQAKLMLDYMASVGAKNFAVMPWQHNQGTANLDFADFMKDVSKGQMDTRANNRYVFLNGVAIKQLVPYLESVEKAKKLIPDIGTQELAALKRTVDQAMIESKQPGMEIRASLPMLRIKPDELMATIGAMDAGRQVDLQSKAAAPAVASAAGAAGTSSEVGTFDNKMTLDDAKKIFANPKNFKTDAGRKQAEAVLKFLDGKVTNLNGIALPVLGGSQKQGLDPADILRDAASGDMNNRENNRYVFLNAISVRQLNEIASDKKVAESFFPGIGANEFATLQQGVRSYVETVVGNDPQKQVLLDIPMMIKPENKLVELFGKLESAQKLDIAAAQGRTSSLGITGGSDTASVGAHTTYASVRPAEPLAVS